MMDDIDLNDISQPSTRPFAAGIRSGYLAAVLQFVATVVSIIAAVDSASHGSPCGSGPHHNSSFVVMQQSLREGGNTTEQAACLNAIWSTRHSRAALSIAAQLLTAAAAWLYMPVVLCIADVLRIVSRGASRLLFPAFFTFSVITTLELVFTAGLTTTTTWMWSTWDLDVEALRMLTIAHWVARSTTVWFFALDLLCLGVGMLSIWYAAKGEGRDGTGGVPRCLAHLSLAIGVLCAIYFVLELARFGSWVKFSQISFLVLGIVGFILIPIWLVVWSRTLSRLQRSGGMRSLIENSSHSGRIPGGGVKAGGAAPTNAAVIQLAARSIGRGEEL